MKDYSTSPHLAKLYQDSTNNRNNETQGNFLELDEDIAQYANEQDQPEVHTTFCDINSISLDNPINCILDSGTSHIVLRDRKYFSEIIPSSRTLTTIT